jgi:hypothetical protein
MAKSVALFTGVDTGCRHVQVAYRADGVAFGRAYGYSKFGKAWTKWRQMDAYEPLYQAVKNGTIQWGFKTLAGGLYEHCRLPSE